jgi:glycosyltransferase involved in cell wall biosynthesis
MQGAQSESRSRGIGRYSLALSLAIARNAQEHELWLVLNGALGVAVEEIRRAFAGLIPRERIRVFDVLTPSAELEPRNSPRARANELLREYFIAQIQPDAVLVTSLFEGYIDDSVVSVGRFTPGINTAVILYDLIPMLNPGAYLATEVERAHYERKVASLRRAGLLLAISDYSRLEAIEALGLAPEQVVAISTAVDASFCPAPVSEARKEALRAQFGLQRDFIMYAPGGFDNRKNIDGLISAFSQLPAALRARHQLLIASKLSDEQRITLEQQARRCGLAAGELVLTGYVSDAVLIELYRSCALFVFASRHEGFGLPALEAMSCGAPVIGSNTTSVPEVIGYEEAMFDPADPAGISAKMAQVLSDPAMLEKLRANGRQRAAAFSWDHSAKKALRALEHHHASAAAAPVEPAQAKPRIAFVSPLPPAGTAAAGHAAAILAALLPCFEIDLVVAQESVSLRPGLDALPRRDAHWLLQHADDYAHIVYHLADSAACAYMLPLMATHPGVVVLHDFYLGNLLAHDAASGAWPRALFESHGYRALQLATSGAGREQALRRYPANRTLLQDAQHVIVHSGEMRQLAQEWYGPDAGADWSVVPLPHAPSGEAAASSEAGHISFREALAHASERRRRGRAGLYGQLFDVSGLAPDDAVLYQCARSIARAPDPLVPRQLLVDVTAIAQHDERTGIERVVRTQLLQLLQQADARLRVEPVYLVHEDGAMRCRYARQYAAQLLGIDGMPGEDALVDIQAGDIYYSGDHSPHAAMTAAGEGLFANWRMRGVETNFVVYDLLPVLHPEFFPPDADLTHGAWLACIAAQADRIVAISAAVAGDMRGWLARMAPGRRAPLITSLHLGADIGGQAPPALQASERLRQIAARPSFLMVGTIEPRKGHLQALDAFELLWEAGIDVNLVIVGNEGWKGLPDSHRRTIPRIVERLRTHPERGRRLLWLAGIDDEELQQVYLASRCLLAPSEGEGFGLPLIEAARHGIPVLARDLPVFREVGGEAADYFNGLDGAALAGAVREWLARSAQGGPARTAGLRWMTWEENVRRLLALLQGGALP